MRGLVQALEPLWWGLFVTGTFVSALLLPGILLVLGIAAPLGLVPPESVAWGRIHELAGGPIGRLVVLAVIVTCLWNGAHHLRHFNIDMGGLSRDTAVALVLYAIAGVASLLAIVAVVRL